ncbi:hypothetical protein EWM64_g3968 [Hericium alpestre]|uniref:Uncharacterized protein n=1 Tax=Hericium alpestre TaxID=135208 RepID=A0A4Z0A159_9AGAM|nr:hypothetical protein EWM64_g3968 [Hericium alpestre]
MPPNLKRKQVDDDDDSDPSFGLRQILPVANLPGDFSGEPMDGLQYLFTVRREMRGLPVFTRAPNPYEMPDAAPVAEAGTSGPKEKPFMPSEEWQQTFIRRFKNFQKNVAQPTLNGQRAGWGRKLMPDKKDRDAWWAFLEGAPVSVWDPPRAPKKQKGKQRGGRGERDPAADGWVPVQKNLEGWADEEAALPHPSEPPSVGPSVVSLPEGGAEDAASTPSPAGPPRPREPTPTLLRHIDHRLALHLLMYFTHWLNLHLETLPQDTSAQAPSSTASTPVSTPSKAPAKLPEVAPAKIAHTSPYMPTDGHARWIFALLSRVDAFCSGDEISTLRALARSCLGLLRARRRIDDDSGSGQASEDTMRPPDGVEPTGEGEPSPVQATDLMSESACWMIVSIIVGVWGQRDLWMDAEDMLA